MRAARESTRARRDRRLAYAGPMGRTLGICLLALAASAPSGAGRVVVVGDVHGAYGELKLILHEAELTDETGHWAGGDATLVFTGDFLDRGVAVRSVLDLVMGLEAEAPAQGGAVVALLGNHEIMNLLGVHRDVDPRSYAAFVDGESEARRERAWSDHVAHRERRRQAGVDVDPGAREEWLAAHPPGSLEFRAAIGPKGVYGRWLRERPVLSVQQGHILMHAGLDPELDFDDLGEIDARIGDEIEAFDRARADLAAAGVTLPWYDLDEMAPDIRGEVERLESAPRGYRDRRQALRIRDAVLTVGDTSECWCFLGNGPLWFRGYTQWDEHEGRRRVEALLRRLDAQRFVVAHAPQRSERITARFGGRVILIDTGMLGEFYGGRPSALEIEAGRLTAIYPGERVPLSLEAAGSGAQ